MDGLGVALGKWAGHRVGSGFGWEGVGDHDSHGAIVLLSHLPMCHATCVNVPSSSGVGVCPEQPWFRVGTIERTPLEAPLETPLDRGTGFRAFNNR